MLCCDVCQKKYKTEGGLTKHLKAKHPDNSQKDDAKKPLYTAVIKQLVNEAKKNISDDECYPTHVRNLARSYNFEVADQALLTQLMKLYTSLCKNSDAEKFYSSYYQTIVMNAATYFKPLEMPVCTILATSLADKVLGYHNKPDEKPQLIKPITSKELDGLQYLAGYVMHAVSRKVHAKKSGQPEEKQALLTILNSARSENPPSQRLVKCQTRGGLWEVKPEWVALFKLAEEAFRKETSCSHISRIDCDKILDLLLNNIDVISIYNNALANVPCITAKETRSCLLEKILNLYLRVRAFSAAKDKNLELNSKKEKGLRNALKKSKINTSKT